MRRSRVLVVVLAALALLVPGLDPPDHQAICTEKPGTIEYYEPSGYRRIPLTTCQGGKELDYTTQKYPCPGKEPECARKNGISGWGLFFAVTTGNDVMSRPAMRAG